MAKTDRVWDRKARKHVWPGARVTVRMSASMTLRLQAIEEQGDPLVTAAYRRLVVNRYVGRVVDKANGFVYLRVRASKYTFAVPATATEPVKSEKSAK